MKSFHPFRLDETNQCLWRGDSRLTLTPKPFAVLKYLVDHPGRLVTHDELLTAVWPDTYVQPEVLRRYILEIRRVLSDQAEKPRFVETLPKRGYQFIAPVLDSFVDGSPSATTKLVGRQSALSNLSGYLTKALHGQRQVVFVSGEAGIGKTSLVDAFQRHLENAADVRVTRGQAVEGFGGKEAYYPIFEALGQLTRGPAGARVVNTFTTHAPTWLVQFPSLVRPEEYAGLQREVLGATRERMVRELCEALEVISQTTTLVLILEDLHWVDHSTVDLFSAIARRREPAKLLIVGTFRPADLILSESPFKTLKQDLLLHHLGAEVMLERLNQEDVANYLTTEFVEANLPTGFASIIHRHSDGNPLFMTAMLDHLVQQGVLSQENGRWSITVPLEQIDPGVPETLRQMLEVQLQHSTDAEQQLLKCASVAGQQFTAWAVATMMGSELSDVEEACTASAERLQFLKASGLRELPGGVLTLEYEFRHALYREVLNRKLGPAQRVKFHRLLALGLESLRSKVEPEAAAEIALHFEEGREYEKAIQYLIASAQNATRRYAHRESVETLEHALGLLPKLSPAKAQELDVQILEKIGDSQYALGDMERSAATYHLMATHAAEAGLLTAQANALMRLAHSAEAIPFFTKAIELDPNFASAYVSLSRIYSNLGELERATEYAKLAYEHRDHVSERERLSIDYQYFYEVTGDQTRAAQTLEVWKNSFPQEFQPANSLAYQYNNLGQFDRAMDEAKEAVKRNPSHGFPYSNLAHAFRGAGQFDEARRTAEEAVARKIETVPTRRLLYQLAILEGDDVSAAQHIEWSRDRPREFEIVGCRAQIAGCFGRVSEAGQLYEETVRMAEFRNLGAVGTNHLAWASWMEMVFGNTGAAVELARRVLSRTASYDARLRVALPLAMAGLVDDAEAIVSELVSTNPQHTIISSILAPIVRAGIALAREEPEQSIEILEVVAPYELGFIAALGPLYLRAQSYVMQGSISRAAQEFQRILDHRGSDPFSAFYPAALVGAARAHAMSGNVSSSLHGYVQFLDGWKTADSDTPLLRQALEEYEKLSTRRRGRSQNG